MTDWMDSFTNISRENKLLGQRTIFLTEAVTPESAARVVADLILLDAEKKAPIYLYINSPGGEVNSGFSIFDTIRFLRSDVIALTIGMCASIATIINVAVKKEHRLSLPNAKFLIHQPLISGQVQGPASDIAITAAQIQKTRDKINALLAEECGQAIKRLEEDTKRDYWLTANEALEYGLISKIISSKTELTI